MRKTHLTRTLTAACKFLTRLLLAVSAALATATGAIAQSAEADDPPGRAGRISYLSGPVQMIDVRTGQGEPATLNWPITSAQRLSTERLGRAEVRIGSLAARLDGDTEVEFSRIDDEVMQIVVLRGSVALRVRNREHLRELDLATPRARIVLEDIGRYRIDVDRAPFLTEVTAFSGRARILSERLTFFVSSGQRGELETSPVTGFRLVAFTPDPFDDWVAARDRRDDVLHSVQYVSPETTGIESLDEHGSWRTVEDHGPVWFPSYVPSGWMPYRHGRWGWVAPWGWTWIDDAPWGFAPFHYGRWIVVGGTWGWVPGIVVPRPAFAPALVAWFGQPGLSVSIGIGARADPIGWFPLGPREIFIPGYRCSRRYINIINVQHVVNIHHVTVIAPPPRYAHRDHDRSTWAPGNVLIDRSPVQRVVTRPPRDWHTHATGPRPPVEPPRDIKKHPTPIPMPRSHPVAGQPDSPRSGAPSNPATPVPPLRTEEPMRRRPQPDGPRESPRNIAPPQIAPQQTPSMATAPASPAVPVMPRIMPRAEERRASPAHDDDAVRHAKPPQRATPPQERAELRESAQRNGERERGGRSVIPSAPPAQVVVQPPARQPRERDADARERERPGDARERDRAPEAHDRERGASKDRGRNSDSTHEPRQRGYARD